MNRQYAAGVRLEREIMKYYADRGYITVRTAGSHSCFDVIAIPKEGNILAIQSKRFTKSKTKPAEAFNTLKLTQAITKIWVAKPKGERYDAEKHNRIIE